MFFVNSISSFTKVFWSSEKSEVFIRHFFKTGQLSTSFNESPYVFICIYMSPHHVSTYAHLSTCCVSKCLHMSPHVFTCLHMFPNATTNIFHGTEADSTALFNSAWALGDKCMQGGFQSWLLWGFSQVHNKASTTTNNISNFLLYFSSAQIHTCVYLFINSWP